MTDDVRLSCLSEDAGGLLGMVDFPSGRVKAATRSVADEVGDGN